MNSAKTKKLSLRTPRLCTPILRFALAISALAAGLLLAPGATTATAQAPATAPAAAPAPVGSSPSASPASSPTSSSAQNPQGRTPANDAADTAARDAATRHTDLPTGFADTRTEFQQMVETTTGRRLPIYGAALFSDVPSTFAPVTDVPVAPTYVLGPGDELDLQMSGQVNQQMRATVDRTGAISLPGLGAVHVAGLSYGELTSFLNQRLGTIYRNFTLNVNLGSLRTIQIFVVGQARRPGAYSISSLSTLTNAIFASGGPLPQGSLRDIQVKRNGVSIAHFDLYDLLLRGDKTQDIPLITGDVIFIPFVGHQIAVIGSIDNPAIYELKDETTVAAALALAGGETAVAAGSSVRLERIFDHAMRSLKDVPRDQAATVQVENGDILSVTSVLDRFKDAVTLRGNVASPGRYVWHAGMHISDLIPNKESLITRNYWRKRNQLGQSAPDYLPDQPDAPVQPEGALAVHGNAIDRAALDPNNRTGSAPGGNSVGAALTGNSSPFSAKNDVILSAPDIYWSYAVIERQSSKDLTTSLIPFDLGKLVLDLDSSQNFELLAGDVVTIFSKADLRVPSNQQTRYVRLEGEFSASGVYSVLPGETLRGLLTRVGGFTPEAYLYASEFTRESTRRVEAQRLREYADELEAQIFSQRARGSSLTDQVSEAASEAQARAAIARLRNIEPIGRIVLDLTPNSGGVDAVPDLALEDGDRFVVPRTPASVTVQGQVYNANAFVFSPNEHVIDYLRRSGGPDREADKKRIFLLRADGSVVSRQYANVDRAFIFPGDTIVVPPNLNNHGILQRIVTIASIIGNFGIGAATIAVLAGR